MSPDDELPRLRAKSDQDRIDFLTTDLQACFTFASVAETEHKTGHQEAAERSLADAEKGYATVLRFVSDPKHSAHIPLKTHHDFKAELQRLRTTLDQLRRTLNIK